MPVILLQPDGVAISAADHRRGRAATYGGGSGRAVGGRSGFRVDTPANVLTVTTTSWTLLPCAAMIDPGASTHQGMYGWASDANIAGTPTPPDATLPRKDIYYIQVNDSTAGDGSGAVNANVSYLAGTPNASPTAPALPARSFLIATATVPQTGGGAPTMVINPARFAAAGGLLPIGSATDRATVVAPYVGQEIQRLDLTQISPAGVRERWNGTSWDHFGSAQWTTNSSGLSAGTAFNLGAFTQVAGKTTDTSFVTVVANGGLQFAAAGTYTIDVVQKWSAAASGRAFITLDDTVATPANIPFGRSNFSAGEDTTSLSVTVPVTAGQIIYPKVFQSTGTVNVSGVVRVKRV